MIQTALGLVVTTLYLWMVQVTPAAAQDPVLKPLPVHLTLDEAVVRDRVILQGQNLVVPLDLLVADVPFERLELQSMVDEEDAQAARSGDTDSSFTLNRGEPYILRTDTRSGPTKAVDGRLLFPHRILFAPEDDAGDSSALQTFAAFVGLERRPVPWSDGAYRTRVEVGIDVQSKAENTLQAGVTFDPKVAVRLSGTHATVTPAVLYIEKSGVAGYQTAEVVLTRPHPQASVEATSDLGVQSYPIEVEQNLAIDLSANKFRLKGFGLESTQLVVSRSTPDGTEVTDGEQHVIIEVGERGHTQHEAVIADGDSSTTLDLTSQGTGTTTVTAKSDGAEASLELIFAFPGLLLAAVLVGAALGGLVEWIRIRYFEKKEPPLLLPRVFVGFVAGVLLELVVGLGLSEVQLLDISRTEAGALVVSFVGSYLGMGAIDLVIRATGLGSADGG